MAIDTPAKLAILGAGPIGVEAALYARFLGYDVVIFEREEVAASVRKWGHVRMFTPFGLNRSPLGLAALRAQDEKYQPPGDEELLTGNEWAERYLLPLSQTDLLADHLRLHTEVAAIGKEELLKGEMPGHEDRGDWSFRLLVRDSQGERMETADAVLDCAGVYGQANWLGEGGIPAIGERKLRGEIEYRLPDILGRDRERYAGRHTLLVGAGYSAATNVVALAQLAREAPGTSVTWITRREGAAGAGGPIVAVENDRLPGRERLAREANRLASEAGSGVTYWPATTVQRVAHAGVEGAWTVDLSGRQSGSYSFDQIIANVGFRPDNCLYEELQIHECYASQGPMKLAAALLGQTGADCLDQKACGPQTLVNPEANYYLLGSKSYGRKSNFLLSVGLEQIREVFKIIGDRQTLDLYASAKNLLP